MARSTFTMSRGELEAEVARLRQMEQAVTAVVVSALAYVDAASEEWEGRRHSSAWAVLEDAVNELRRVRGG